MKKSRFITTLATSLLLIGIGNAQVSLNTAGGNYSSSGGIVAFSLGQIIYITNISNNHILNQGVQNAYEIYSLNIEKSDFDVSYCVFPIPTSEKIILKINNLKNMKYCYKIYDVQGVLLNSKNISSEETQIDFNYLPSAIYFIEIKNESDYKVASFKIIKK